MWLPVSVLVFLAILPVSIIAQASYALVATLAAPKSVTAAYFGNAVHIGTDRVAAVAPMDKVGETAQAGAAYVFDLSGKLLLSLASPYPRQKAGFGGDQWASNPLAMDGDLVAVGEALAAGGGRAYAFDRTGSFKAIACTGISPGGQYGRAVAKDGDSIVVAACNFGAWLFDHGGKRHPGCGQGLHLQGQTLDRGDAAPGNHVGLRPRLQSPSTSSMYIVSGWKPRRL